MRKCKTCGKTEKQGAKFSTTRKEKRADGTVKVYYKLDCNKCHYQAYGAGRGLKRDRLFNNGKPKRRYPTGNGTKGKIFLTTMSEREEDGWKCLALDILTMAVLGMDFDDTPDDFWHSWDFELYCAMAEMNPEYLRRGIRERGSQAEP